MNIDEKPYGLTNVGLFIYDLISIPWIYIWQHAAALWHCCDAVSTVYFTSFIYLFLFYCLWYRMADIPTDIFHHWQDSYIGLSVTFWDESALDIMSLRQKTSLLISLVPFHWAKNNFPFSSNTFLVLLCITAGWTLHHQCVKELSQHFSHNRHTHEEEVNGKLWISKAQQNVSGKHNFLLVPACSSGCYFGNSRRELRVSSAQRTSQSFMNESIYSIFSGRNNDRKTKPQCYHLWTTQR